MSSFVARYPGQTTSVELAAALLAADHRIRAVAIGLANWYATRRAAATTEVMLYAMSDRELNDIGLTRFDVQQVAQGWSPRHADAAADLLIAGPYA